MRNTSGLSARLSQARRFSLRIALGLKRNPQPRVSLDIAKESPTGPSWAVLGLSLRS
jgi:hypothetical protein